MKICKLKTNQQSTLEGLGEVSQAMPKSEPLESTVFSEEDRKAYQKIIGMLEKRAGTQGCWEIKSSRNENGYGRIRFSKGKKLTHRVILEFKIGRFLLPFECALHKCDNPPCNNPDHLFVGTRRDNVLDAAIKGRMPSAKNGLHPESKITHCPSGHEYTPQNTIWEKKPRGIGRKCKQCSRDRAISYYYKHQSERIKKCAEYYQRNRELICKKLKSKRSEKLLLNHLLSPVKSHGVD